ncbi:MAG TPA: hypothetical protein DGZ24_05155 [Rhodospirillaceae bacterium]|nr:hypothetical protein [Rhodospirillaceae bacterium]
MMKFHLILSVFICAVTFPLLSWSADPARTADIAVRDLTKSDFPRWKELAPNVYAYADLLTSAGTTLTTVSLIVVTSDGVVIVDGQNTVVQGEAMVRNIKKITSQPIKYMVIASDHGDHVNANPAFKAAYPDIVFISSPVSQKVLSRIDFRSEASKSGTLPTEVVSDKRTLSLGGTDIQILNLGRGHTGGDLIVYLPKSKVLFLGELYLRYVFPAMVSAYPSEWVALLKKVQTMDVSWFVPGHGFIGDSEEVMKVGLDDALEATEHVISEAKRLYAKGLTCEVETNCPAMKEANWESYSDWTLYSSQAPRALARVYKEIEGKLP